ncbi:hypothetical protein PGT21_020783 [Puccinia graminis f. sp. tritici]|uniref:Uncharacterized protein n=1 Tax=Puccinia graminis f. sp. tritici TaxID=56615 RepID=A0A5B0RGS0_PUCGR|nr:hypothetical protein PGT21_020783 [Puccinia graminis f. sp. tritici]KAA1124133.1 hypothetical protein PGTUg99_029202 [Puccinia graminis f. sp. tritici]
MACERRNNKIQVVRHFGALTGRNTFTSIQRDILLIVSLSASYRVSSTSKISPRDDPKHSSTGSRVPTSRI